MSIKKKTIRKSICITVQSTVIDKKYTVPWPSVPDDLTQNNEVIDSCEVTNLSFPKFLQLADSRRRVASDRGWLFRATSWL